MILNVSPSLLFKGAQYTNRRVQALLSVDHEDIVDHLQLFVDPKSEVFVLHHSASSNCVIM